MNTLNRVLVVAALVIVMLLVSATLVMPHIIFTNVGQWMVAWGEFFNGVQPPILRFIIGLLLAAVFNVVFVLLIFFEVRPQRKKFIRVQQVTGGMATISIDSIIHQLQHRIDPLPGVIKVSPKIRARGDKVQAIVDVEVGAGSSVPNMASQLVGRVQTVLEDDLGLQTAGVPEVRLRMSAEAAPEKHPVDKAPFTPPEKSRPAPDAPPPLPTPVRSEWAGMKPEEDKVKGA